MPEAFDVHRGRGVFRETSADEESPLALGRLLDRFEGRRVTWPKRFAALEALVAANPGFIDGHVHVGNALFEKGRFPQALAAYREGIRLGEELIPTGFAGRIEWRADENQPFFRALHGAALCHVQLGDRPDALSLMERMLAWNPEDNLGIRYLIGSEYLRGGDTAKARTFLQASLEEYPPCRYELALLSFRERDYVAAATSLRRGFIDNPYIPEALLGGGIPMPMAIWHDSNFAEGPAAENYAEYCGDLWRVTSGALYFLRWLHTHPRVLAERAVLHGFQEALLWEDDFERRKRLVTEREAAKAAIDDKLSKEIVKTRTSKTGRPIEPWLHFLRHMPLPN